jgi:hypothetical protein
MLKITGTMMLVLMLTTLTASAAWLVPTSSDQSSMATPDLIAATTWNGNGLRYGDLHNNNMTYDLQDLSVEGTMWLSKFGEENHWISFGFEGPVMIEELTTWNFNDLSQLSAGIQDFRMWYTKSDTSVALKDRVWEKTWDDNDPPLTLTLNRGTGSNYYQPNTTINIAAEVPFLEDMELTGLMLEVMTTYGSSQAGLSEIHFEGKVPEPATMGLLAVGGIAMLRSRRRRNNK